MGNCHIYDDHIDGAQEQIKREPYEFPTLNIKTIKDNINDYTIDDFEIVGYKHHPKITMKMRA